MSTSPQVVVRGEAVLTVPPEVADVVATVRVRARDRRTAIERCHARLAEVTAVVTEAGDAVESVATTGVSVHDEDFEHRPAERVAVVQTQVVLARIAAAGELLGRLADLEDVAVAGPHWRLRPDSPAHEEARLAALRDAVRRARLYAGALGAEITGLVEVADAGLARSGGAGFGETALRVAAFESSAPALELTPQQLRVHGSVEVRFDVSVPDPEVFRR
jgi:uncharacterized protein YggE